MRALATLICVFALSVAFGQTPPKARPFTIEISAKPSEIESGTQVRLVILTKNLSEPDLKCNSFRYEIWDASGKELPKKPIKYSFCVPAPCNLPPGGLASLSTSEITTRYDLTAPGRYTVQVSLPGSDKNPNFRRIYSNKITLTVLP